jgi:hypothetical protein
MASSKLTAFTLTPVCEHSLTSYMWLRDAANFPLPSACSNAAQQPALAAFLVAAPHRVDTHVAGCRLSERL